MSTTQEIQQLEAQLNADKASKARSEGALEQTMGTISTEYGVDTIEDAQALLDTYRAEAVTLEKDAADKLDAVRVAMAPKPVETPA